MQALDTCICKVATNIYDIRFMLLTKQDLKYMTTVSLVALSSLRVRFRDTQAKCMKIENSESC